MTTAIFRHTHSLGIRRQQMERITLPRAAATLQSPAGPLPAKSYQLEGQEYLRPEQDALADAAHALGLGAPGMRLAQAAAKVSCKAEKKRLSLLTDEE